MKTTVYIFSTSSPVYQLLSKIHNESDKDTLFQFRALDIVDWIDFIILCKLFTVLCLKIMIEALPSQSTIVARPVHEMA